MRRLCLMTMVLSVASLASRQARADDYKLDNVHSSVTFKIEHNGIAFVYGRFDQVAGDFMFDKTDPTKAKFVLTIQVASVDTNQKKRDDDLRSANFFDAAKFPEAKFVSKAVKAVGEGWHVDGDFTLHGVTKPVSFVLKGGKTMSSKGPARIGFWTEFTLKRTEFGMTTMVGPVGDEVHAAISFEGVKK